VKDISHVETKRIVRMSKDLSPERTAIQNLNKLRKRSVEKRLMLYYSSKRGNKEKELFRKLCCRNRIKNSGTYVSFILPVNTSF
jgi:hypothetical protein